MLQRRFCSAVMCDALRLSLYDCLFNSLLIRNGDCKQKKYSYIATLKSLFVVKQPIRGRRTSLQNRKNMLSIFFLFSPLLIRNGDCKQKKYSYIATLKSLFVVKQPIRDRRTSLQNRKNMLSIFFLFSPLLIRNGDCKQKKYSYIATLKSLFVVKQPIRGRRTSLQNRKNMLSIFFYSAHS